VTAVIGGGDTAIEEALFLTTFAKKVYLIHRRESLRGSRVLIDRMLACGKVELIYNSVVESLEGGDALEKIIIKDLKSGRSSPLAVDGFFIFVGSEPNTSFVRPELLEHGMVSIDSSMKTSVAGLFAAGDCRSGSKRQIVLAAADGALAAMSAYEYISGGTA
jgi:thioredoxin reductase (NADPH)